MGVGDIDRGFELFLAREPARLTPSVFVHNLQVFAAEIEHEYFPQPRYVAPVIQWGKSIGRKKRHSIRLGSYHRPSAVIRIHPRLNAPDVPHFFVKSIIHHEYLHHVLGPNHNRRFRRYERKFRFYRESKEWLRRHLPVLLGHRVTPLPHFERRPNRPVIQLGLFGM